MFGSPEMYFDLAKLHHRELIDEAAKERVANRVHRHGRKRRQARDHTAR
ncbi:hypothetical protein AB0B66_37070 [Catellatospora sp. NPDC049111]|jgi:hypothetical protein|uniref:Uncharacterized protein n=2 Tax=Catellatospora TaxID=53365 RepID=A0A8J3KZX8_9ACTN|nr:hypothetical protein [Catellatospora coxensis]GIG04185.1 hypothetical protein Cco03nite_08850 [Catellatospora coxensis]